MRDAACRRAGWSSATRMVSPMAPATSRRGRGHRGGLIADRGADGGDEHAEDGPGSWLRVHGDGAACLGNDAVDGGQPEAGAAIDLFGGEEGFEMRLTTSGLMPVPVSVTVTSTYCPGRMCWPSRPAAWSLRYLLVVAMVRVPPCGMASRAFTDRLSKICPSRPDRRRCPAGPRPSRVALRWPLPGRQ